MGGEPAAGRPGSSASGRVPGPGVGPEGRGGWRQEHKESLCFCGFAQAPLTPHFVHGQGGGGNQQLRARSVPAPDTRHTLARSRVLQLSEAHGTVTGSWTRKWSWARGSSHPTSSSRCLVGILYERSCAQ